MLLGLSFPPIPGPVALATQLRDTARSVLDSNTAGQAYGFLAITPIKPGESDALRAVLAGIDEGTSPFARLPRTHFARWVILDDFYTPDPEVTYQPEDEDRLECEYLIFSACFDGDRDSYLDALTDVLADEAQEVWSHCIGVDASSSADLRRYLLHNQIDCGLFYSAYPHTTVPEVRRMLQQQRDLRVLAVQRHTLTPAELQADFLAHFGAPR